MDDQRLYLVLNATFSYIVVKYNIWCLTLLSAISWWRKLPTKRKVTGKLISKMRCLDGHYLILCISYLVNILYKEEFENTKGVIKIEGQQHTHTTKDSTLKYRVRAPQGQHIKVQSMSPTGTSH
jgi:hypothetical protein